MIAVGLKLVQLDWNKFKKLKIVQLVGNYFSGKETDPGPSTLKHIYRALFSHSVPKK